jgi:hypothetical protein
VGFGVGTMCSKTISNRVDLLVERFQKKRGLVMLLVGFLAGFADFVPQRFMAFKDEIEFTPDILKENFKMIFFHGSSNTILIF